MYPKLELFNQKVERRYPKGVDLDDLTTRLLLAADTNIDSLYWTPIELAVAGQGGIAYESQPTLVLAQEIGKLTDVFEEEFRKKLKGYKIPFDIIGCERGYIAFMTETGSGLIVPIGFPVEGERIITRDKFLTRCLRESRPTLSYKA